MHRVGIKHSGEGEKNLLRCLNLCPLICIMMKSRSTRTQINPEQNPKLTEIHPPKIRTVKGRWQTTWRSRGIYFPWSESPALCLFHPFLPITGKMIPGPICTQLDRHPARQAVRINPPSAKLLAQLWGNTGVQHVTWSSKSEWAGGNEKGNGCSGLIFPGQATRWCYFRVLKGRAPEKLVWKQKNTSMEDEVSSSHVLIALSTTPLMLVDIHA